MIDFNLLQRYYLKCFKDKSRIYMIQNYLKTYDATQKKMVRFNLFPKQQDLCQVLGNANNVVTTKPRQAGITTTVGAFISCEMCLADPESPQTALVIGNTLDLAQQMVSKIREFLLQFPAWMWGDDYITDLSKYNLPPDKNDIFDICNQKELKLKNGCRVVARSSGPDASRGVGGVQWLILDEAAFIENGKDVYASAIPTVSTGGHIIMISTPNGKDQLYYETCRLAELKGTDRWNNFELVKMKWYQDPRYNKHLQWYRKNSEGETEFYKEPLLNKEGDIKYDDEHWIEMIKDGWRPRSPWYIKMCQQFNNDEVKIAQELDVSFLGSASNVVAPEYIEMQEQLNVKEPLSKKEDGDMFHLDETWIWKPPIPGHKYIMSCLPPGEKVLTSDGLKNIEDVNLNEKLIDKNGEQTNIVNLQSHYVNEEKIYKFKISNFVRTTRFTGNHPIWASKENKLERCYKRHDKVHKFNERYWTHNFKFIRADELSENDWIEIPNIYYGKDLNESEILSKWDNYTNDIRYDYAIQCPLLDEDFWWYVGMWLAKGWAEKTTLHTAHHIKQKDYTDKICKIFEKYNRNVKIFEKPNNSVVATFTSKQISSFLVDEFGKYAFGKRIPEWVKYLPVKFKSSLIDGYLSGDGCFVKCNDDFTTRFVSISLNLIEGIQDILMSMGILSYSRIMKTYYDYTIHGKKIKNFKEKYELTLGLYDTIKLCKLLGYDTYNFKIKNRRIIRDSYFSNDLKKIYFKIKKIDVLNYTGNVYNFETESHTYCCKNIVVHNCDCSRGDAADRTAIEILDLTGVDDDGKPCIEQVLEYHGKRTGDEIGEIAYWYGMLYGEAFCTVDCIGGTGDACILTMMRLGYKNLYYDDPNLNKYTIQREQSTIQKVGEDKLPGFHSNAVRFQMLTFFANMVKTNQIKIRSKRVIAELDTWIYKGNTARIDHQDGCHDDTLTCLAMAVFVANFHLGDLEKAKERDATFLRAWINSAKGIQPTYDTRQSTSEISTTPKKNKTLPIYNNRTVQKVGNTVIDSYRWLLT